MNDYEVLLRINVDSETLEQAAIHGLNLLTSLLTRAMAGDDYITVEVTGAPVVEIDEFELTMDQQLSLWRQATDEELDRFDNR